MSEPFRPYEKLVEITVMGKKFQVPERNSLLRCFQFISPETIPYGRFCWNQDCQYCRVSCQLPDDDEPREMLSCKFFGCTAQNGISPRNFWLHRGFVSRGTRINARRRLCDAKTQLPSPAHSRR